MSKSLTVAPEDEIKTLSSLGLRLVQLLRITAVLWLLILFAIDQSFVRTPDTIVQKMFLNRPNGVPPLPSLYYLFHCLVALSVLR